MVIDEVQRLGFECKRTSGPKTTPSMRTALADLRLKRLDVIHCGGETFPLGDRIRAVPLDRVWRDVAPLRQRGAFASRRRRLPAFPAASAASAVLTAILPQWYC